MLESAHFARTLQAIVNLLPFAKPLDDTALLLAWRSMPHRAKVELSNDAWTFAASQFLMDPAPPAGIPIHLAMLRYLYRMENGAPNLAWGLKADLPQRMAAADAFHPQPIPPAEGPAELNPDRLASPNGVLAQLRGQQP